jgi:hypothetical protein
VAYEDSSSSGRGSGFSQSQLRPLLAAHIAGFLRLSLIGLHGRPKKAVARLLRNWYLTT